ncbi:hypothetical protein E8E14_010583 [Neopestalotiopsis sp. 37M]|nr:hypothetical protein E8E14_010583 [Neopestalotiopsis sp. 37M]
MEGSQLSDINTMLVTESNSVRKDVSGMDHARCAALHNYLVHYARAVEDGDSGNLTAKLRSNHSTFFTTHGAAADEIRTRLHPSVVAFLDAAITSVADAHLHRPFFFWSRGLSDPDCIFANDAGDLYNRPADSLLCLYLPGANSESGGGVLYDQVHHRAAVSMDMDAWGSAMPLEAHMELWHPLETIFSNWIHLLHIGKIAASTTDMPSLHGSEKYGPWEWRAYSDVQVIDCVSSWNQLCAAIESRMAATTSSSMDGGESLLAPDILDAASVPNPSFARAFLTRARRPQVLRYIAPGLLLPPADAAAFTALQRFTRLPRGFTGIPPVYLFPAERSEVDAELTESARFHFLSFNFDPPDASAPSRAPAGLYSEPVDRAVSDVAEEGFRLLLPYALDGDVADADDAGARMSDGSRVRSGETADLFQHGYKPFGGDLYRAQRLERLFDHWRNMIETSIWSVGPQGVEGTIQTFKQADATAHWKEYCIPPTW